MKNKKSLKKVFIICGGGIFIFIIIIVLALGNPTVSDNSNNNEIQTVDGVYKILEEHSLANCGLSEVKVTDNNEVIFKIVALPQPHGCFSMARDLDAWKIKVKIGDKIFEKSDIKKSLDEDKKAISCKTPRFNLEGYQDIYIEYLGEDPYGIQLMFSDIKKKNKQN